MPLAGNAILLNERNGIEKAQQQVGVGNSRQDGTTDSLITKGVPLSHFDEKTNGCDKTLNKAISRTSDHFLALFHYTVPARFSTV